MENYSPRSINLKLSALRPFFKWANGEGEFEDFSATIASVKIPPTSYFGKTNSLKKTRMIFKAAEFSEDRSRLRNLTILCMMARVALSTYDVCKAHVRRCGNDRRQGLHSPEMRMERREKHLAAPDAGLRRTHFILPRNKTLENLGRAAVRKSEGSR